VVERDLSRGEEVVPGPEREGVGRRRLPATASKQAQQEAEAAGVLVVLSRRAAFLVPEVRKMA
jgi:hypothetical protein